jgi:GGDEF domain-containing protein
VALPSRIVDTSTPGELLGKRVLAELSRAIERFALAAAPGEPLIVIAMFQKLSYFEQASTAYRDLAARGVVTVVGMAEDSPPPLPPGVDHALVEPSGDLAREWSVTVLGPHAGATLVATDLETIDPVARTLEEGRCFRASWSFRRQDAYEEALRLRSELALPEATVTELDRVLDAVRGEPEPGNQDWWSGPLRYLVERVESIARDRTTAVLELDALRDGSTVRDPRTGLYTQTYLDRWTDGLGAGTLPIGLALLRVFGIAELRAKYGLRAELAALQGVTACVQELLTPVDRVVRLGREDFLAVLPSWAPEKVLWFCEEVCARVARLDEAYPFVALPGVAAATVTRNRPLPVEQLRQQVLHGGGPAGPVSVLTG